MLSLSLLLFQSSHNAEFLYHMWCLTSTFLGKQQEADQQYLEADFNLRLISLTWNSGFSDRSIRPRVKKVLHMLMKLWKLIERNTLSLKKNKKSVIFIALFALLKRYNFPLHCPDNITVFLFILLWSLRF